WQTHRNGRWWQRVGNHCLPYDGPRLPALLAACDAPDGSHWALQQWQPRLPHRGYPPYAAGQTDWELDISHWTGPVAELEVHADWAFDGQAHNLFGRLRYAGVPVHGFHTVKGTGAPKDRYGRSLYIDTFDSAYGPGWKRETSIVFRNPSGVFCYSFWPTHDVSLPRNPGRPAGHGSKYRIEVEGPAAPTLGRRQVLSHADLAHTRQLAKLSFNLHCDVANLRRLAQQSGYGLVECPEELLSLHGAHQRTAERGEHVRRQIVEAPP